MARLSAVLIVRNEAAVLPRCLASLAFVDEIVVIDDASTDDTVAIAEAHGARVFHRRLDRFDTQRNFGIAQATGDWILSIDADEQVTAALAAELREVIERPDAIEVYGVPFRHRIFGRWVRHGGWGAPLTRLYRRTARWGGAVHEQVERGERYGTLRHPMLHYSHEDIGVFLRKLDGYTTREAAARVEQGARYSSLQMMLSPLRDFWRRYVLQRGYRDGTAGLILAVLMAIYIFTVRAKAWQLLAPTIEPPPLPAAGDPADAGPGDDAGPEPSDGAAQ